MGFDQTPGVSYTYLTFDTRDQSYASAQLLRSAVARSLDVGVESVHVQTTSTGMEVQIANATSSNIDVQSIATLVGATRAGVVEDKADTTGRYTVVASVGGSALLSAVVVFTIML